VLEDCVSPSHHLGAWHPERCRDRADLVQLGRRLAVAAQDAPQRSSWDAAGRRQPRDGEFPVGELDPYGPREGIVDLHLLGDMATSLRVLLSGMGTNQPMRQVRAESAWIWWNWLALSDHTAMMRGVRFKGPGGGTAGHTPRKRTPVIDPHIGTLPAAIQAAFTMAGVAPRFMHGLNRPCWLSTSVTVDGQPLLLIDDAVDPDQLEEIVDRLFQRGVDRLTSR